MRDWGKRRERQRERDEREREREGGRHKLVSPVSSCDNNKRREEPSTCRTVSKELEAHGFCRAMSTAAKLERFKNHGPIKQSRNYNRIDESNLQRNRITVGEIS